MKISLGKVLLNKGVVPSILVVIFLFFLPISSLSIENQASETSKGKLFTIEHDQRPTVLEYALMSKHAYDESLQNEQSFDDLPGWKIHMVERGPNDFCGVVFRNDSTLQFVVSYKGTDSNPSAAEDLHSVVRNFKIISPQEAAADILIGKLTKEIEKFKEYHLSFTGHSLGAFLAEVSVMLCYRDRRVDSSYPKEVNAVTFESPGSKPRITEVLQAKQEPVSIDKLDIIGYVANPNTINTLNLHVGTLYHIEPNLNFSDSIAIGNTYLAQYHSIENIVNYLKIPSFIFKHMSDWLGYDEEANRNTLDVIAHALHTLPEYQSYQQSLEYYFSICYSVGQKMLIPITILVPYIRGVIASLDCASPSDSSGCGFEPTDLVNNALREPPTALDQLKLYNVVAEWDANYNRTHVELKIGGDIKHLYLHYLGHYEYRKEYSSNSSLPLKHFSKNLQEFLRQFSKNTALHVETAHKKLVENLEGLINKKGNEDVLYYLANFYVENTDSDDGTIVCLPKDKASQKDIYQFRNGLSKYLHDNPEMAQKIISLTYLRSENRKIENNLPNQISEKYRQPRKDSGKLSQKLNALEKDESVVKFFITGIPGTGKTELAKEYAHTHKNEYSSIRVFNAESPETLQRDFELLAGAINPEEFSLRLKSIDGNDAASRKQCAIQFISENLEKIQQRWLWIFVNAEKYENIKDYINMPNTRGTIIVTTKQTYPKKIPEIIPEKQILNLNSGMIPSDAIELLYKIAGAEFSDEDKKNIKNILGTEKDASDLAVTDLNCLPLAISGSAFTIMKANRELQQRPGANKMTFKQYRDLLAQERKNFTKAPELEELENDSMQCATQAIVIRLLIQSLDKESQAILELCSCISTNHIPRWLLNAYLRSQNFSKQFSIVSIKRLVDDHPLLSLEFYGKNPDDDWFFMHQETSSQMRRLLAGSDTETKREFKNKIIQIADLFINNDWLSKETEGTPLIKHIYKILLLADENSVKSESVSKLRDQLNRLGVMSMNLLRMSVDISKGLYFTPQQFTEKLINSPTRTFPIVISNHGENPTCYPSSDDTDEERSCKRAAELAAIPGIFDN